MTATPTSVTTPSRPPTRAFEALAVPGFKPFLLTFLMTMMADNIEHVLSYWVIFQKFHSPALGGFAVVSHWLPYLLFSVAVGALNDRFDSRRLIQLGMFLFICASAGWGYFFVTDTLQMWHAMVLLVLHGFAGVFWITSSQMLLYRIVGPTALPSAVRLNATARYIGVLVGPGVGSIIMSTLGPTRGIFLNTIFYLPLVIWLIGAPFTAIAGEKARRAVRGIRDIVDTIRDVRAIPVLATMILLAGGASFFVGNSYQAQMPGFANDLGQSNAPTAYSALLAADAAGALVAGFILESGRRLPTTARNALKLAMLWALALAGFALARLYGVALALLFMAGFFELSFSSMTQTLVQMNAPDAIRGRVLGLFNMASAGLRTFSGITVGLMGSVLTVHTSLAASAGAFIVAMLVVLTTSRAARATAT